MAGRTPREAVGAFYAPLHDAALCITDRPFVADGFAPSDRSHSVTFQPIGEPVLLDSRYGRRTIGLTVTHLYGIARTDDPDRGPWEVESLAYSYELQDREGNELFSYHWDPSEASPSWAKFPHLHVSGRVTPLPLGSGLPSLPLGGLHFPTDQVAFDAVVRMLLREFRVPARRPEAQWTRILADGEAAFSRWRRTRG